MEIFKIYFYDGDHGGMHTVLRTVEYFEGTYEEAYKYVKTVKSPWGFFYTPRAPGAPELHGIGIIRRITKRIREVEIQLTALNAELKTLYENL